MLDLGSEKEKRGRKRSPCEIKHRKIHPKSKRKGADQLDNARYSQRC